MIIGFYGEKKKIVKKFRRGDRVRVKQNYRKFGFLPEWIMDEEFIVVGRYVRDNVRSAVRGVRHVREVFPPDSLMRFFRGDIQNQRVSEIPEQACKY